LRGEVLDSLIDERVIVTHARETGLRIEDSELERAVQNVAAQNQLTPDLLRERLQAMHVVELDARVLGQTSPLNRMLDAATRECCVPRLRWHDLRHTFGTWLAERVPYAALQALLGHAGQSVTDRYLHVRWESLVESVRTLPDLLPGGWREFVRGREVSC
jgi:hypothetical protein